MTAQFCIIFAIIIYLLMMILIGINYSKKNSNVSDFYLGGRKLGPLVTAMSAEASDMSSWLLMGLPGVAYLSGIADASWTAIGLAVGTYINWLVVAKRIRLYSQATGSFTLPDFFSKRYGDDKNLLTCVSAIIIVIIMAILIGILTFVKFQKSKVSIKTIQEAWKKYDYQAVYELSKNYLQEKPFNNTALTYYSYSCFYLSQDVCYN